MPRTSAARRASWASSRVQQPRAPSRNVAGFEESARWMPVTSWPASTARAAATAESTPPDIAARTRMSGPAAHAGEARPLDDRRERLDERGDVGGGGRVAQREAERGTRRL